MVLHNRFPRPIVCSYIQRNNEERDLPERKTRKRGLIFGRFFGNLVNAFNPWLEFITWNKYLID